MIFRCALISTLIACQSPDTSAAASPVTPPQASFTTAKGNITVKLEIADTPRTREEGLMHRKSLPADQGMLFVFSKEEDHRFWMKNTYLHLDMIFVNAAGKIIGIIENAEPGTLHTRGINQPSLYVIEVNGGFCRRYGIEAGTPMSLVGIPEKPAIEPW